ncbi:hypothetical protein [Streptacidiphilus fuscans]|uniref:Uncharacterized protein n=1 Tax=Streptacidiphilus fuscans TaxID=2789292 RepID=A0A931AXN2_9ACTN|nr:hypothetical protein [Streptacidiphilus fuscans]MBF9067420.1 hypothetical protein [Streptacidiphilus fuscans]
MSDPRHDALGDRLRLLGTPAPAPALPAAEIRRRADRRRRRRHALGATAACTAAALCLALASVLNSPEPLHEAAPTETSSVSASPGLPVESAVASTRTTPIGAGAVAGILASCLGSDASDYRAVIAVRSSVAAQDTDGVVVAVNSARQYVQCEAKGDKGSSMSMPPTFINDRLWGTGHLIEFFDSFGEPADGGRYLALGAGHYTSDVAKVTISYGQDPTEYPAVMADGAFVYTAALSTAPTAYVHAYNAAGQEIYNQRTDHAAR